jgi:hypothetical protein
MTTPTNVPASPDTLSDAFGGIIWPQDCTVARKLGKTITKEPHPFLRRHGAGTPEACAAWDKWAVEVRKALPLERRVQMCKGLTAAQAATW